MHRSGMTILAASLLLPLTGSQLAAGMFDVRIASYDLDYSIGDSNFDGIPDFITDSAVGGNPDGWKQLDHFGRISWNLQETYRAVYEFDVTALLGTMITDASFGVSMQALNTRELLVDIYAFEADGVPSISDWFNTDMFVATWDPEAFGRTLFDVTSQLQSIVDGNATHAGFIVVPRDPEQSYQRTFGSSHGSSVEPVLTGSFALAPPPAQVPEPSSLILLGIGVCGLFGNTLRRRRTSRTVDRL